ncbi:MAG: ABC transporter substrate-binding protein [Opitutaceae bacterium]
MLKFPPARILITSVAIAGATWLWGSFFRSGTEAPPRLPREEVAALAAARQSGFSSVSPPVVVENIDYASGSVAAWQPKGEAPVLEQLVREGKLPPVEQRTGAEPLVLRGPEGIGRYGGIWNDAVTWPSQVWDRMNRYNAGVTLTRWSPSGYPIVPNVAKRWEASEDLKVWTFFLRRGMKWSDGHPFTANDFIYWYDWEVLYFQRLGYALNDDGYRLLRSGDTYGRVERVDDYTVRFVFPQPNPFFLELIAGTSVKELFAPRHYLEKYHPELGDPELIREIMRRRRFSEPQQVYLEVKREDNPEHPRINPWIYRRYSPHAPHAFVRNPYYWAVDPAGNQLPYIDQITEEVVTPELLALKTASGGYPAIFETADLKLSNYGLYMAGTLRYNYDVRHYGSGQSSLWSIVPNLNLHVEPGDERGEQKAALLQSREFRQALSLAINRRAIIRAEFFGFGEPAQVAPAPASPFHSEQLYKAFTGHDPGRADALLDGLGLTRRDTDGYRTLPDGSPMVWFIIYSENTPPDIFQFVLDDWAAIGIRAHARPVTEGIKFAERMAASYEFYGTPSYVDFIPVVDPKSFVPVDRWAAFAPVYGRWYESRLLAGHDEAAARAEPPPPGSVFADALDLYEQAMTASSRDEGIRLFRQLLDRIANEVWSISIASAPPAIAVVRNDLHNVPLHGITGNVFHTPLNLGAETFYFENPGMSPGAIARLREDLTAPQPSPLLVAGEEAREQDAGRKVGRLLRWLLGAVVVAGLGMLAVRHPFVGRRLMLFVPMLLVISII